MSVLTLALSLGSSACSGSSGRFVFVSNPPREGQVGSAYSHQLVAVGGSGATTYALVSAPTGMSVTTDGLVVWGPVYNDLGTHTVTATATDSATTISRTWNLRIHQGIDLGVTLSPRGHTGSSTAADFVAHFDPENGYGELRAFHGNWRDSVAADGEIPALAQNAGEWADTYGFTLSVVLGWSDGNGAPDLTSETDPTDNSWNNVETRNEYLAMVTSFAATYRPTYLFLGNETNSYFVTHSSTEWNAWIDVYELCYDAIKVASPSTAVGTVFQLEKMRGGGSNAGWSYPAHWQLIDDHAGSQRLDVLGFTSYPYFDFATPSAIPSDYYTAISARFAGAVAFTEIGWLAAASGPYPGGEADQAGFLIAFFARTATLSLRYVAWLFEHDWDQQSTVVPFIGIGLKENDGSARTVDGTWRTEVALRQR